MTEELHIGCYTGDRGTGTGIAVVTTDGGIPSRIDRVIPADSPSFVIRHPTLPVLYAVIEADHGRVAAWRTDDEGGAQPFGAGDTGGADPCHLTVDATGTSLVTVNYTGGSIAVHRLAADGRIGERTDLVQHDRGGPHERQAAGHPHMVRVVGDGVIVSDLGADGLFRYHLRDGRLALDEFVAAPPATGPRHFARAGRRWLVTAELSDEVLVYAADWTLLGRVPANRFDGESLPSELVVSDDDRYLYVANRGADTISVFALDDPPGNELPVYLAEVPTGRWPRHMALAGDLLYDANQQSGELTTMRVDAATGLPEQVGVLAVPTPTCVLRP
jgi:6-phosphogluconolactonase (cycloisomerase 2 family)